MTSNIADVEGNGMMVDGTMAWSYSIYVLPSLIFAALSLREYSFELCFYAYLVLLISFVFLLHWSYRNDCEERSILQKFGKNYIDEFVYPTDNSENVIARAKDEDTGSRLK